MPIGHIFLALQVLAGPLQHFDKQQFIIGTSFPDIRYLGSINRNHTHFKGTTFPMIKTEPNAFRAGMLFHSFVDEKHAAYIKEQKLLSYIPKTSYKTILLKIAEDKVLIPYLDHEEYVAYFDTILLEETTFGIPMDDITRWHAILQTYCNHGIKRKTITELCKLFFPNSLIKQYSAPFIYNLKFHSTIKQLSKNELFKKSTLNFYLNFFEKFISSSSYK